MPLFLLVLGPAVPFYPFPCMFGKFLVLSGSSSSALKPSLTLSNRRDHSHLCASWKLCVCAFSALSLPSGRMCLCVNSLKAESTSYCVTSPLVHVWHLVDTREMAEE